MKRPDCGNQRTGQPRCAQLTAKTWNCSAAMRRTQQAVSAVLPSVGITYGLRKVASRVSASGNSPSVTKGDPREVAVGSPASDRGEKESHNRYGQDAGGKTIE